MKQNLIIKKAENIIDTAKDESRLIFNIVKLVKNLIKDKKVPKNIKHILYAYLIYFISPIDIIPDFIPTGYMDDLFIGLVTLSYVLKNLDEKIVMKNWEGDKKLYKRLKRHCRFVEWILPKFIKRYIFAHVHRHAKKHLPKLKMDVKELVN
ncbi:DUF1232 domain-containing protein [Candidatus Woesearchaeota archaeon]|nr:DUF1232 domain-containing protein [Candidatus Woesearchaeota archaeon]